jgi:hypothetical protein
MTDLEARAARVAGSWALTVSLVAGLLAFCIAREAGVPVWRDWEIGDATDIGFLTYALIYCACRFHMATRKQENPR